MNKTNDTKKLTLRRETLRELTTPELTLVAGGGAYSLGYSCTCPSK
jgi:hypothetical protein